LRVSLEWLSEYVDLVVGAGELAELLTNSGTAVEAVETTGEELQGFVVGEILEVWPHPAADRLSVCRVDLGGQVVEIVCGAPNARAGIRSPVAPPGTRLPDGTLISEVEIRGVVSRGMLLSEKELALGEDSSGIMELEGEVKAGTSLVEALSAADTVLVLEITPNRPDCLSMLGVAREVAALTGVRLRRPSFRLREDEEEAAQRVGVEILDGDLCSRYVARVIDGVRVGPSPWWMRRRLRAAGIRPINNVVDVTNYVMMELGQPLHAFDYRLVREGKVIVRRAAPGETITTLDGVERRLHPDDLLICDPAGPIALAGVMGGEHTEVSEETACVLLESAHFNPAAIMRTSRTQDLTSEASYRFERGVDPGGCLYAADRASCLMAELAGGRVLRGAVDVVTTDIGPRVVPLRVERARRIIGVGFSPDRVKEILLSLEMGVREEGEDALQVEVPTFRPDLEREIDLVEEIARIHGYQNIPSTLPATPHRTGFLTREQRARRRLASIMVGAGMREAITVSFIHDAWLRILDPDAEHFPASPLRLRNPLSEEAAVMRPSLLPGLLEAVRYNVNRRLTDVHLFEMGRVFVPVAGEKLPREPVRLGCVVTGRWIPKQWDREPEEADLYTLKGVLERIADGMHWESWSLARREYPFLHPGRSGAVLVGGEEAGYLGVIHPRVAEKADIPPGTAVMELEVDALVRAWKEIPEYREVPRYPSVTMDLAVVVREEVEAGRVEEVIRSAGGELLREVRLFDLYRGGQVGEGEKSLAFNLVFYALDRTLREEEAQAARDAIVQALRERVGARLR